MRDGMVDREKVIKGLECCTQPSYEECIANCPYGNTRYARMSCCDVLMADALALLKALDVSPEELERLKMCRAECKIDCLLEHYNKVKDELDAMKKVQKPKSPIIKENSYGWKFYYCASCGKEFYQNNKFSFCEKCGQAVKWE